MIDHDARSLALISRAFDGIPEGLTRDDVLDNITLFWDEHRRFRSQAVLGKQARLLLAEGREDPGGGERLSR